MKKVMYWFFNIMLGIGVLATALGLLYYAEPRIFEWFFDFLNIGEAGRSAFVMTIGGTTIAGAGTKILRTVVNTDNLKRDALHKLEMKKINEKHDEEIALLKSDFAKTIEVITETSNDTINAVNVLVAQNELLLEERQLNAKRMIASSPKLVPNDVKTHYREFLGKSQGKLVIEPIENFYVKNTEIIKIKEEPIVDENTHIPLSQRLAKEKEQIEKEV